MKQISPADLAKHLFKTDGHFAPNPYPLGSSERAEFSGVIFDLYVKDTEESKAQLNEMFNDPIGQLDNIIRGLSCQ